MSFWCSDSVFDGLHTVAIKVNDDGKCEVYNRFSKDDEQMFKERKYDDFSKILINGSKHGKFICGYYLPKTIG